VETKELQGERDSGNRGEGAESVDSGDFSPFPDGRNR